MVVIFAGQFGDKIMSDLGGYGIVNLMIRTRINEVKVDIRTAVPGTLRAEGGLFQIKSRQFMAGVVQELSIAVPSSVMRRCRVRLLMPNSFATSLISGRGPPAGASRPT
jgi:hypothetical protein